MDVTFTHNSWFEVIILAFCLEFPEELSVHKQDQKATINQKKKFHIYLISLNYILTAYTF